MTDLVERLRATFADRPYLPSVCAEAADEIERLRAWNYRILQRADTAQVEVERLRNDRDDSDRASEERDAEIERLTTLLDGMSVNLGGSVAALKMANDEIQRMQAEIDQFEEQLAEATTEIEKLRDLWENSPSAAR